MVWMTLLACGGPPVPVCGGAACLEVDLLEVTDVRDVDDGGWVLLEDGSALLASLDGDELILAPGTPPSPPDPADWPELLPDSVPWTGDGAIRAAWLAGPTDRYAHGALGDGLEATTLSVTTADGATRSWSVAADAVLEDLRLRPADVDRDGDPELWVVRATEDGGAAPVVVGLQGDALVELGAGDPLGTPFRWLDPIGADDLDGDGVMELMWIARPHLDGTLTLGRWEAGTITVLDEVAGYSNHRFGSTDLAMATLYDVDGDGRAEAIVPDERHAALHVVSAARGRLDDLGAVALPADAVTDLVEVDAGAWVIGLVDGTAVLVRTP